MSDSDCSVLSDFVSFLPFYMSHKFLLKAKQTCCIEQKILKKEVPCLERNAFLLSGPESGGLCSPKSRAGLNVKLALCLAMSLPTVGLMSTAPPAALTQCSFGGAWRVGDKRWPLLFWLSPGLAGTVNMSPRVPGVWPSSRFTECQAACIPAPPLGGSLFFSPVLFSQGARDAFWLPFH